jgi:hypothetical protein
MSFTVINQDAAELPHVAAQNRSNPFRETQNGIT